MVGRVSALPPSLPAAQTANLTFAVAHRDARQYRPDPRITKQLEDGLTAARRIDHRGIVMFDLLTAGQLLAALSAAAEHSTAVCGAWIAPPGNLKFASVRLMERARRSSAGFALGNEPHDGSAPAVAALLTLHMVVLRARTPAQWAACHAVYRHGTTAAAGAELGISHQAVSKAVRRAGTEATSQTQQALIALLGRSAGAE